MSKYNGADNQRKFVSFQRSEGAQLKEERAL